MKLFLVENLEISKGHSFGRVISERAEVYEYECALKCELPFSDNIHRTDSLTLHLISCLTSTCTGANAYVGERERETELFVWISRKKQKGADARNAIYSLEGCA